MILGRSSEDISVHRNEAVAGEAILLEHFGVLSGYNPVAWKK